MIGRFTCVYRGEVVVATLGDDLHWDAGHVLVCHALEAVCRPRDASQAPRQFAKALEIFRGVADVPPERPEPGP